MFLALDLPAVGRMVKVHTIGHCFHFLARVNTVTSHLKSTINTNCMCQNINVGMTNRRFVWRKPQGFMASLMAERFICSCLKCKRTLIQLRLLAADFILCKPCSMSAALVLPAPSCIVCCLCRTEDG